MSVDMRQYLNKVLAEHDNLQVVVGPGMKESFMVDFSLRALDDEQRKRFHTSVGKLLYLSKWARPDIISIMVFLCTRVKAPTEEDWKKLWRVLGCLKGTRSWMMKIKPNEIFRVVAYVDSSVSAHPDGKVHSEIVVRVGGVSVFFGSRKQKRMSKSPTKAKLVALLDNIGFI